MRETKKKILVTGASGLLGSNLMYCLKDQHDFCGLYHTHKIMIDGTTMRRCDLRDQGAVKDVIDSFNPEIVLHCAAEVNVEQCETQPTLTRQVNVEATRNIVDVLKGSTTKLIYISTDLIYDGVKGDFSEDDNVGPLNIYAQSKLDGEQEALKRKDTLVLRTNFFGWNVYERESLGEWVINRLKENRQIRGFTDTRFSSIYTFDLVQIIDEIIQKDFSGVYNLGSKDSLSKNDFALTIANKLKLNANLIMPISVDEFNFKAKRSKDLSLNISKLKNNIESNIPSIEESIDHFIRDYKTGLPAIFKSFGSTHKTYPKLDYIPYGRQSIDDEDIQAVINVLKSDTLTQGPKISEFEQKLCELTGAQFCVAVNSGTSALHIACLAAGVQPGDEVITSPNSFVASANCAAYCGAQPVFADIDPQTYNISPEEIKRKITEKTKIVIPVHFAGQSCDMEAIREVVAANEKAFGHKITIIEDAAHALGSKYKDKEVGSCSYSDMAIMSFHPVKHITTAEGGAVFTNDANLMKHLKKFRSHGITNDPDELVMDVPGPWYYEQQQLGFNYRMTDVQCALGISQLTKLPEFIQRRRTIVNQYNAAFKKSVSITTPFESTPGESNFHLYVIQIDFSKIQLSRRELIIELRERGIRTQVHYIPIHTQPYYIGQYQTSEGDYPVCEHYYQRCLSLPLYPSLSDSDVQKVISNIEELAGGTTS